MATATNWIAKLRYGAHELDISSGTYRLGPDFHLPESQINPIIGGMGGYSGYGRRTLDVQKGVVTDYDLAIRVDGNSDREVAQAVTHLFNFLGEAGNSTNEPLELRLGTSSDVPEPLYGQGNFRDYRIIFFGSPRYSKRYYRGDLRATQAEIIIPCKIEPFAVGRKQRVALASGGLVIDNFGWKDKQTRGVMVGLSGGNLVTNPIFGHSTWNQGWANGASIEDVENTDARYSLFGLSSALLRATSGTAAQRSYVIGCTASGAVTGTVSAYMKNVDGSAVTNSHVQAYIPGVGAINFDDISAFGDNGWYLGRITFTLTAGLSTYGIAVTAFHTLYLGGLQVEEYGVATPMCHGDLMGHTWASTAHASASTRSSGKIRLPWGADFLRPHIGSLRVVVKWNCSSSEIAGIDTNHYILRVDTTTFIMAFNGANLDWRFLDASSNTADSSAQTFSRGDIQILHFTYSATNGMNIYIDGAVDGTQAAFQPDNTTRSFNYIGSTSTPTEQPLFTIMGLETWKEELTAAQILADYNNLSGIVSNNQQVSKLPVGWQEFGADWDMDNGLNASTDGNYLMVCEVPGTERADTIIDFTPNNDSQYPGIVFSILDYPYELGFIDPLNWLYQKYTDATADTAAVDNVGDTVTIDTGSVVSTTLPTAGMNARQFKAVAGKTAYIYEKLRTTASVTLLVANGTIIGGGKSKTGVLYWTSGTAQFAFRGNQVTMPKEFEINLLGPAGKMDTAAMAYYSEAFVASGTQSAVRDYTIAMHRPMCYLPNVSLTRHVISQGRAVVIDNTSGAFEAQTDYLGDPIEFVPDAYNLFFVLISPHDWCTADHDNQINGMWITPRWRLA